MTQFSDKTLVSCTELQMYTISGYSKNVVLPQSLVGLQFFRSILGPIHSTGPIFGQVIGHSLVRVTYPHDSFLNTSQLPLHSVQSAHFRQYFGISFKQFQFKLNPTLRSFSKSDSNCTWKLLGT